MSAQVLFGFLLGIIALVSMRYYEIAKARGERVIVIVASLAWLGCAVWVASIPDPDPKDVAWRNVDRAVSEYMEATGINDVVIEFEKEGSK